MRAPRLAGGALCLLLAACASAPGFRYVAPAGVPASQLEDDLATCREESGVIYLDDERERWVQHCMSDRGYGAVGVP